MHLMRIQLIYYFVQLLIEPCVKGFNVICPGPHQRIFRSKEFCKSINNPVYSCLYNTFSLQYSENCTKMEYASRKGRKIVFSPAINEIDCKDDRFQPIPFTTNSFTDCLFGKSKCNEEGQVLISNGSTIMDRICRCDYRNGYAYVTQPKDKCFCVPSQEDCSCFSRHCKENEIFSADYHCVQMNSSRLNVCGEILDGQPTAETTNINNIFVDDKEHPSSFAPSALTGILILLCIPIVLIVMLWYLLSKVKPQVIQTSGISEIRIIYTEHCTPKIYHVIEEDNFTISCEIKSLLPIRSLRWQKDRKDIKNLHNDKYKSNDSKTSLTIKNISVDDTGTYECIVSNCFGLGNTTVDRCVSYLSNLHKWMTWVQVLHDFSACRMEDQNKISVIVYKLPVPEEHGIEKRLKGDKVTMNPSLKDNPYYVVWYYRTEDILRAVELDKNEDINDELAKPYLFGDTNDGAVKRDLHWNTNDGAVKRDLHDDKNGEAVKSDPHYDTNAEAVKSDLFCDTSGGAVKSYLPDDTKGEAVKSDLLGDTNGEAVKRDLFCDTNGGSVKSNLYGDTIDGAVKSDLHGHKYEGGTCDKPPLTFKTAVSDTGQYVCFVVTAKRKIVTYGWKLKVIPQEMTFKDVLQHRKDKTYVKTSTVDKAVECLKNNGFVVIVGRKGTGKSKMCLQLESVFEEKDYLPFEVPKNMDQGEIADLKSTKIIFFLDELDYSPKSLDRRPEESGNTKAKVIDTCRHEDSDNSLQLSLGLLPEISVTSKAKGIFICRHENLPTLKEALQKKNIYSDKAMVDLDKKANIMTLEEKREIVEKISKSMGVELDVDLVNKIINIEPFLGFPLVVNKFCSKEKHLQKGEKYFINPPKFLRREIADLYKASVESKKPDLMNKYCVLAFIATDKRHCINLSTGNTYAKKFQQLMILIYHTSIKSTIKSPPEDIVDHVDSLVWKYLVKSDDHTYRFIHPIVSKAVFLSSQYFVEHIIQSGEIEDIIELIRGVKYELSVGESVLKLEVVHLYNALCERLTSVLIEKPDLEEKIGDYIYHHFIKLLDEDFIKNLFHNLKKHFSFEIKKQNERLEKPKKKVMKQNEVIEGEADANVNQTHLGKQDSSKAENCYYSPSTMITLIEHLTRTGRDLWIYSHDETPAPDCVILYGLIMACKNNLCNGNEDQKKKFGTILNLFSDMCKIEDFQAKLCTPLDMYGNVFCHFLTLFCEDESYMILEKLLQCVSYKKKEDKKIYKVENMSQETPMQMSAYLGKAKVFKKFFQQSKVKEKKRKHLLKTAEIGMMLSHGSGSTTSELKSFLNLDKDFSQLVLRGKKDDYANIIKTLQKK